MITRQSLLIWWAISTLVISIYYFTRDEKKPLGPDDILIYAFFIPGLITHLVLLIWWALTRKLFNRGE